MKTTVSFNNLLVARIDGTISGYYKELERIPSANHVLYRISGTNTFAVKK